MPKSNWLYRVAGKDYAGVRHAWNTMQPSPGAAWAWLLRLHPEIDYRTVTVKVWQPGDPR